MHSLFVKVSTDKVSEVRKSLFSLEGRRMELLIEKGSVGSNAVIYPCHGIGCSGRSVYITSCHGSYSVRYRHMRKTPVRSGSCLCSERHIGGNRVDTCLVNPSPRILILPQRFCIKISSFSCEIVNFLYVITVFR